MLKQISLVVFSLVLIISLSGCQKKANGDTISSNTNAPDASTNNFFPVELLPYIITVKNGNVTSEGFEWGDSLQDVMTVKGWTEENVVDDAGNKSLEGTIPFNYPPGDVFVRYKFVDNKLWDSEYFLEFATEDEYKRALEILAKQADMYLPKPSSAVIDPIRNRDNASWFNPAKGYVTYITSPKNVGEGFTIYIDVCSPVITPAYANGYNAGNEVPSSSAAQ